MWVVKIGGSMNHDPLLPQWLDLLSQLGGGRVTIVAGGGSFADEVRREQARWHFDDLTAHNMALLAMAQVAQLLHALNPTLQPASNEDDIRRVLRTGRTVVWSPLELLRTTPDATSNWDTSSDSIALGLALRLNAERLVVLKSCDIDLALGLDQLGDLGIVDRRFAALAQGAAFPIDVVSRTDLPRVRSLLLGERSTA